jgi:hypothetical protein
MEAPEVPIEEVQEHVHHTARHGHGHGGAHQPPERWTMGVALSTALFAALAAIASLIAGGQANEAMKAQIESANSWSYYQAKSIKANLLDSKDELLAALGHEPSAKDEAKRKEYEADKEQIKAEALAKEHEAKESLEHHERNAHAVTMFQVAIALAAIAVLTKRRLFWMIGLGLGAVGIGYFGLGFIHAGGHGTPAEAVHATAPAEAHPGH